MIIDAELARLAVVLGVVVGIVIYRRFGVIAGGTIVPGYLALYINQPLQIAATFALSIATYLIVNKIVRPRWILWGSRLFEVEIAVSFVLHLLWLMTLNYFLPQSITLYTTIGFVLPGIIAHSMGNQGAVRTLQLTLVSTAVVFAGIGALTGIRSLLGIAPLVTGDAFVFDKQRVMLAIALSLFSALLVRSGKLGEQLGTGGFITAAYVAFLLPQPRDVLVLLGGAVLTWLIVTQVLAKRAILFGRIEVATMILVGMLITWAAEFWLITSFNYTPWPGLYIVVPLMMALLARDTQRYGPVGTLMGTSFSTAVVFGGMQLLTLLPAA